MARRDGGTYYMGISLYSVHVQICGIIHPQNGVHFGGPKASTSDPAFQIPDSGFSGWIWGQDGVHVGGTDYTDPGNLDLRGEMCWIWVGMVDPVRDPVCIIYIQLYTPYIMYMYTYGSIIQHTQQLMIPILDPRGSRPTDDGTPDHGQLDGMILDPTVIWIRTA